ncbi:flippase-like domain-containing protein [Marinilongibacter aquaticus]|uniref:lysylphosphatidylglycerol synthase transmembrane domain-containing protein n=1 Tax=Marinilongibacter aquaticus TaxID=2975157 RepID=UPI0021BD2151|nr:lysylphosphatidylglycerol synthase transmembrane domain-containing protein [Marinilongibacter aquaticus]UBM60214.1 flippase-like domain-containing protein [Marinilongibacter aquaticus]
MKPGQIIKFLISAGITLLLLWFVLKGINLDKLWENIKEANYFWVLLAGFMALVAHWSRAYRWKLMLQPMGYDPSAFRSTLAVLIGYLTNLLLPRAGELARSASLKDLEKVPFEKSFGAVVAERIIDLLVLALLIMLNLALEFDRLKGFFIELLGEKLSNPVLLLSVLAGGLLLAILCVRWIKKNDEKLSQNNLYNKAKSLFLGLWEGFTSIRNLKKPRAFIAHTLLIWTMYYLMTWFLCFSMPQTAGLGPLAGLTMLVMGTIGMAAPTVGGIGSYHFLVGKIVELYGLNAQDGITLATFMHTMQGILFVVLFGLTALLISFFIRRKGQSS